jgi:inner membrane protein
MDSLTQAVLGAAVGEAALGRRVGNKAAIWGAVLGTLPDLDVFYPFADPVSAFTWHRGPSHSILVLAALSPLVVWLIGKAHPGTAGLRGRWLLLVLLVFGTHVLLDCFTVYGTQPLWPLPMPPVGWGTIFIIDPLYTLPLTVGLIATLVLRRRQGGLSRWNMAGLVLSSAYLSWSAGAKLYADHQVRASLARQDVAYERLLTQPTPFNTLLWRVVGITTNGYFEGFWSMANPGRGLDIVQYDDERAALGGRIDSFPSVQRLRWFTKGFYRLGVEDGDIVLSDLRMGVEPNYVFAFKVGELFNPHPTPSEPVRLPTRRDFGRLRQLWDGL